MRQTWACLALSVVTWGCGSSGRATVAVEVSDISKMPFHGPGGAGSEPISITFTWTVVVHSSDSAGCNVGHITTRLTEAVSGSTLVAESDPSPGALPEEGTTKFKQSQGGFYSSALYDRVWQGHTVVEVKCSGGLTEQAEADFAIQ
jgi:hypothetical protein